MTGHRASVLLVADNNLVQLGLRALLHTQSDIAVVGAASTVQESVGLATTLQPDVVVMDLRPPYRAAIKVSREIRDQRPETKVLVLVTYANETLVCLAVLAGASGYLLKDLDPRTMLAAVITVANGGSLFTPSMAADALDRARLRRRPYGTNDASSGHAALGERILPLIAAGRTNREITDMLALSERVVRNYVCAVYSKLVPER